jgi:hypothetical protein
MDLKEKNMQVGNYIFVKDNYTRDRIFLAESYRSYWIGSDLENCQFTSFRTNTSSYSLPIF